MVWWTISVWLKHCTFIKWSIRKTVCRSEFLYFIIFLFQRTGLSVMVCQVAPRPCPVYSTVHHYTVQVSQWLSWNQACVCSCEADAFWSSAYLFCRWIHWSSPNTSTATSCVAVACMSPSFTYFFFSNKYNCQQLHKLFFFFKSNITISINTGVSHHPCFTPSIICAVSWLYFVHSSQKVLKQQPWIT